MEILLFTPLYLASYVMLAYGWQIFFASRSYFRVDPIHLLLITVFFLGVVVVTLMISDIELANRIQHALGGGFLMIVVSYFSRSIARVEITKIQFFMLSILISTAFGVANELVESILQNMDIMIFASTINDTWFDLWANSIGAIVGASIFTPFIGQQK